MATERGSDNPLQRLYSDRIGHPDTGDEAMGYWIFALGALIGILGFALFVPSESATGLRELAIAVGAVGLPLMLAGPVLRLPLERSATALVAVGIAVCFVAVAWFVTIFPSGWDLSTGHQSVMGLYALGLAAITAGGVFVPMLTPVRRDEREELQRNVDDARADEDDLAKELEASRDARNELQKELDEAHADEAELAEELEASYEERNRLQQELDGVRTDKAGIAEELDASRGDRDELQQEVDDTLADEDDLAKELVDSRAAGAASAAAAAALERPESQASFEIYEDAEGMWRWRLRHRNGNILADSGQGYARRTDAQNGMQSVRRDAFGAAAIAITPDEERYDDGGDGASAGAVAVADADESKATFEIYEDEGGEQWRWRLLHDNGNIIADSGQGYASKSNVKRAMSKIRDHFAVANYLHVDPAAYELYEDEEGMWRWRLIHENGNVLASAAQGYDARPGAREAVTAVKETLADAEVTER